jgi:hypothetical protein
MTSASWLTRVRDLSEPIEITLVAARLNHVRVCHRQEWPARYGTIVTVAVPLAPPSAVARIVTGPR